MRSGRPVGAGRTDGFVGVLSEDRHLLGGFDVPKYSGPKFSKNERLGVLLNRILR
jgi:hypothetical protein